ncbi:hypothetical protein LTR17_017055 [Elasticomyces elasticus]|nr:hypothetical protein LTR17_017055 [Elasticomyces elasticus]
MSAADFKKSYLRVKEDYGGTFNAQDRFQRLLRSHPPTFRWKRHPYHPPEAEGAKLKLKTVKKLTSHAKENAWSVEDVDKASVIMVCPLPDHATNVAAGCQSKHHPFAKRPGWYVIDGIKEFLGLPEFQVDTESQGFVVDGGKDQPVIKVPFDPNDPEFEDVRVEALKEFIGAEAGGDRNWNCQDWDLDGDE